MSGRFHLYPHEQHWWSFADYAAVLDAMRQLRPTRVLEFGPGSSTLALIEGGARQIDACEDDGWWLVVQRLRLEDRFPDIVTLWGYDSSIEPLSIGSIDRRRYDLALIDGPREMERRPAIIRYALAHCAAVLVPAEETEALRGRGFLRACIESLAAEFGRPVSWKETGPLAGSFALIT